MSLPKLSLLSLSSALILSLAFVEGCQAVTVTAAPTAAATATGIRISPTATASATQTPTPISSPTASPTPTAFVVFDPSQPTPVLASLNGSTLRLAELLFRNAPPGCKLPCWKGLIIGQSGRSEVQTLFDTTFGFNHTRDFFADNPVSRYTAIETAGIDGIYTTGYVWRNSAGSVRVLTALRAQTDKLEGVVLGWSVDHARMSLDLTPGRIIKELGKPTWIYAGVFPSLIEGTAEVRFLIVYDTGLSFFSFAYAPTAGAHKELVRYCLNDPDIQDVGDVYLMEPLSHGLDTLSPFQASATSAKINDYQLMPVTDAFGVNEDQVSRMALQGSCLSGKIPYN